MFSFRVDGRLNGVRIRRNFKSQEEAAAEKSALQLKALQLVAGLQSVPTTLTTEQVRDAEAVFRRIVDRGHSLAFYVEYVLAHHREPATQKLLSEAVADYLATKDHEHEQDLLASADTPFIRPPTLASTNADFPLRFSPELDLPRRRVRFRGPARDFAGIDSGRSARGFAG